jgi:hypothetical protein
VRRALLLTVTALFGVACQRAPPKPRVLLPSVAAPIQAAFQHMAPALRYQGIGIDRDQVNARLCHVAGDCFALRLTQPEGCEDTVVGPFCAHRTDGPLSRDDVAALRAGLEPETTHIAWEDAAQPSEVANAQRQAERTGMVKGIAWLFAPLLLGALLGWLMRRPGGRMSGAVTFLAFVTVPLLAAMAAGHVTTRLRSSDLLLASLLLGVGLIVVAHRAFADTRAIALAAATLLVGVGLLEVTARLFLPMPPSFQRADVMESPAHLSHDVVCAMAFGTPIPGEVEGRVGLGRRSSERFVVRPGTQRSVLHVGDSMVFGQGVNEEDTFVARLAALRPGEDEINAAIPGTAPDEYVVMMRHWLDHAAVQQVVLYLFEGNDFSGLDTRHACTGWQPLFSYAPDGVSLRPRATALLKGRQLLAGPVPQVVTSLAPWSRIAGHVVALMSDFQRRDLEVEEADEVRLEHLRLLLESARQTLAARHIALAVVYLPGNHGAGKPYDSPHRMIDVVRSLGIPLADATGVIDAARTQGQSLFGPDGSHFNPTGHALLATWLAEELPKLTR